MTTMYHPRGRRRERDDGPQSARLKARGVFCPPNASRSESSSVRMPSHGLTEPSESTSPAHVSSASVRFYRIFTLNETHERHPAPLRDVGHSAVRLLSTVEAHETYGSPMRAGDDARESSWPESARRDRRRRRPWRHSTFPPAISVAAATSTRFEPSCALGTTSVPPRETRVVRIHPESRAALGRCRARRHAAQQRCVGRLGRVGHRTHAHKSGPKLGAARFLCDQAFEVCHEPIDGNVLEIGRPEFGNAGRAGGTPAGHNEHHDSRPPQRHSGPWTPAIRHRLPLQASYDLRQSARSNPYRTASCTSSFKRYRSRR